MKYLVIMAAMAYAATSAPMARAQDYVFQGFATADAMNQMHAAMRDNMIEPPSQARAPSRGAAAGCPIHLYACVLIQRLDGLRDFADTTATTHTRNIQAEHLSHLISSAAQVTAQTASTLTRWQGQVRKRNSKAQPLFTGIRMGFDEHTTTCLAPLVRATYRF